MENKQHNTALLQKIQTESAAPSVAPIQESRFCWGGVQTARELCYHLAPPCTEEIRGCESQLPLPRAKGYPEAPREGGDTARRRTEPHAGSSQGCQHARGGQHPQTGSAGGLHSLWPPSAGWGEVLVPTHRQMVVFEGRRQEGDREE